MDLKEIFDKWANIKNNYINRRYSIRASDDNNTIITLEYIYSRDDNRFKHTDKITLPEDYDQMPMETIEKNIRTSETQFYERLRAHIDENWYSIDDSDKTLPIGDEIDLVYFVPTIYHTEDSMETTFSLVLTRGYYNGKKVEANDENINFEEHRGNLRLYAWKEI